MMNQRILLIVTLALLVLPAASFAMKDMDSGGMEMDHDGMDMTEDMIMLGTAAQTGVKAMAHAQVYDSAARSTLAEMGQEASHHFMVMFTDEQTGEMIPQGQVAVKVRPAGGDWSSPVKLMPIKMDMGDGFGGDIKIASGTYEFSIGTLLADGQKRLFQLDYVID